MEEFDQFGKPIPGLEHTNVVETDYRLFRYSKFALPWLVLLLLCFSTLFCLTIWQGGFEAIKSIRPGVPRDLEPWAHVGEGDGGLARSVRNLRIAVAIAAILAPIFVGLVFYINPRPSLQRACYFFAAFIIFVAVVMGVIAFCIDVSKTDRTKKCQTLFGTTTTGKRNCESRSQYGAAVTALDIAIAVIGLVCLVMLILWSKDDTFKNTHNAWRQDEHDLHVDDPRFVEEVGINPITPGMDVVHKTLVSIGLLTLFTLGVLLLIFTIIIHEFRERVNGSDWDPINTQKFSGWPRENTRLRLSATIMGIGLCLLSFVPFPNRVYVYVLGFLFFVTAVLHFVVFALDVNELSDAKDMTCPDNLTCKFHPYNTVCAFDFIIGFLLVIYLLYEFIVQQKKSLVTSQRDVPQAPLEEFVPSYDAHPEYAPVMKAGHPAIAGPAMRPLLGVEVIEVEHPVTGELNVTVMQVTQGGASEEAGVRVGDVISRWDEIPITCKGDFAQAVSSAPIGSTVMLQVIRQSRLGPAASSTAVEYCKLTVRGVPA